MNNLTDSIARFLRCVHKLQKKADAHQNLMLCAGLGYVHSGEFYPEFPSSGLLSGLKYFKGMENIVSTSN